MTLLRGVERNDYGLSRSVVFWFLASLTGFFYLSPHTAHGAGPTQAWVATYKGPGNGIDAPTKVFVGGLSWDTSADGLRSAFSKFGTLLDAAIIPDRNTGRSRGFGFVMFEKAVDAEAAIREMNGAQLDGRTLRVNRAEPR